MDLFTGTVDLSVFGRPLVMNHLYFNDDIGWFSADDGRLPDGTATNENPFAAVACDFDADGDMDLYLGNTTRVRSRFLINDGFGRFRLSPPYIQVPESGRSTGESVVDARCTDMDLDGLPDLVLGSDGGFTQEGTYSLFRNQGEWEFEDATESILGTDWALAIDQYWRMWTLDLNADGWPDVLPRTQGGNPIALINQGAGVPFLAISTPVAYPHYVDNDTDGRPDLYWSGGYESGGSEYAPRAWRNQ